MLTNVNNNNMKAKIVVKKEKNAKMAVKNYCRLYLRFDPYYMISLIVL